MKRCPRCGQAYSDDLIYCLQDGSELLPQQPEFQTETPTVIRQPRATTDRRTGKPYLKYVAIGLMALLLMMAAGAVGAYFVWSRMSGSDDQAAAPSPSPRQSDSAPPKNDNIPSRPANTEPTPERERTPKANSSPANTDDNFVDPGTSRIAFRRGRESETVNGRIAKNRTFVLRTLGGQYLTARVSSERNCVIFSDGSTSIEFSTPAGDSRIALRNNCPAPVRFDLNVAVR